MGDDCAGLEESTRIVGGRERLNEVNREMSFHDIAYCCEILNQFLLYYTKSLQRRHDTFTLIKEFG